MRIESQDNDPSIAKLNKYLDPVELTPLIVCQHAAFHRCSKKHLRHWILIIDELPHQIKPCPTPIAKNQLAVFQHLEVDSENKLKIKDGCVRKVRKNMAVAGAECNTVIELK